MGHLQMAVAPVVVVLGLAAAALERVLLHLHQVSRCRFWPQPRSRFCFCRTPPEFCQHNEGQP